MREKARGKQSIWQRINPFSRTKEREKPKETNKEAAALGYESGGEYPLQQEQMSSNN